MNVLALDPATHCGWAVSENGHIITSGVWDLKPKKHDMAKTKWAMLWDHTTLLHGMSPIDVIVFEDVLAHSRPGGGTNIYAAHCYGGLAAMIEFWCDNYGKRCERLGVTEIKKFATGKGNASKADMVATARIAFPDQCVDSDDQADALWILAYYLDIQKQQLRDQSSGCHMSRV
jgi:Holliday junction resolvasome RuvABC endonuclease subunit